MDATAYRLKLLQAGFQPIALNGKKPAWDDWPDTEPSAEGIRHWPLQYPTAKNTGLLTAHVPTLDIDITDAKAAEAAEKVVRDLYAGQGAVLVRTGKPPKRAILFRTDTPFPKIKVKLIAPDGTKHGIEVLGQGQQVTVAGIHPDTHAPYTWADFQPGDVVRDDLPLINEADARELVSMISSVLEVSHHFTCIEESSRNGVGNGHADRGGFPDRKQPVDIDDLIATLAFGNIYDYTGRILAAWLRSGVSVETAVDDMLGILRQKFEGTEGAKDWDWSDARRGTYKGEPGEAWRLYDSCYRFVSKNPELVSLLPDYLQKQWRKFEEQGRTHVRVMWVAYRKEWLVTGRGGAKTQDDSDEEEKVEEPPQTEKPKAKARGAIEIFSSAEFVKGFVPPDYLVDGLLQRRFLYSFTGRTGDGKTSIVLLLAACVALGKEFGGHACEPTTVFILVGENPDDVRMRWMGLAASIDFNLETIDVHFIPGVFPLPGIRQAIADKTASTKKEPGFDTSAAYFSGDEENSNTQLGNHARNMRRLFVREMPGNPCVVVTNHPTKNPDMENLLPRGGGAYVAEVDGNLVTIRDGEMTTVHWHGKFRGPDFDPVVFELVPATAPDLVDSQGRPIPTVIARSMSVEEQAGWYKRKKADIDTVLRVLARADEEMSLADIAIEAGWKNRDGQPAKSRVRVIVDKLKSHKWVTKDRTTEHTTLTDAGRKVAEKVQAKQRKRHAEFA
jgi:hypothetical protein